MCVIAGIELANEPGLQLSREAHPALLQYYRDAYSIVRRRRGDLWVVFNELYEELLPLWLHPGAPGRAGGDAGAGSEGGPNPSASAVTLTEEFGFINVVLDLHLYNWQEPFTFMNASQHAAAVAQWAGLIDRLSPYYNVIVGEWCFSSGRLMELGPPFVQQQLEVFADKRFHSPMGSSGWYIWSWKIDPVARLNPVFQWWDVQYTINRNSAIQQLIYEFV